MRFRDASLTYEYIYDILSILISSHNYMSWKFWEKKPSSETAPNTKSEETSDRPYDRSRSDEYSEEQREQYRSEFREKEFEVDGLYRRINELIEKLKGKMIGSDWETEWAESGAIARVLIKIGDTPTIRKAGERAGRPEEDARLLNEKIRTIYTLLKKIERAWTEHNKMIVGNDPNIRDRAIISVIEER